MKKKPSRFLSGMEYSIYLLIILFFATGRADGFYTSPALISIFFGIFLGVVFVTVIGLAKISNALLTHDRSVFILLLMVVALVHVTTPQSSKGVYALSPLFAFYYVAIITFASCGSSTLWLTAVSLFLVSELGWVISTGLLNKSNELNALIDRGMFLLPHIGYVIGAGGIAYFVSTFSIKNRQSHADSRVSGVTQLNSQGVSKSDTATFVASKTGSYKVKTGTFDTATTNLSSLETEGPKGSRDLARGEGLSSVVFFMSRIFNAYSALGFIFDSQKKVFVLDSFHSKSMAIISKVEIRAGMGIVGNLAVEKVSFLSGNIMNYDSKLHYYSTNEMINSVLAVPILSFNNELLGALVVDSKDKLVFRDNQKDILNRFSQLAAALIANVRMRYFQERVARNSQIFYEAAQQFTTVQHVDQVLDILVNMVDSLTQYYRILAIDFHPESTSCSVRKVISKTDEIQQGFAFPLNDGLYSTAIRNRQVISIDNFDRYKQQYYLFVPEEGVNPNVRSLVIMPLSATEAYCRGVISIESDLPGHFTGELGRLLSTLVSNAAVAYQKAFLYQKMEMLATTDGLTELYNHRTFQSLLQEEISRSKRYKRTMSLLIMDIDHFKNFNDTYGHSVGDLVLKDLAACLKKTVRSNDIPARYGGEEFAVIIPETSGKNALIIGERIRQSIEAMVITTKSEKLHVTVSIGCAGMPEHAATQQQVIDFADTAMYYSKEHGRNKITMYDKKMGMKNSK